MDCSRGLLRIESSWRLHLSLCILVLLFYLRQPANLTTKIFLYSVFNNPHSDEYCNSQTWQLPRVNSWRKMVRNIFLWLRYCVIRKTPHVVVSWRKHIYSLTYSDPSIKLQLSKEKLSSWVLYLYKFSIWIGATYKSIRTPIRSST